MARARVVVAMSGGVDSSVAACVLLREGYDVVGVTMKTYTFDEVGGNVGNETSCCGLDAFNDARRVAVHLGIPHYVADFTGEFENEVIRNFTEEYLAARAARGSRARFTRALARVPAAEPPPGDELRDTPDAAPARGGRGTRPSRKGVRKRPARGR